MPHLKPKSTSVIARVMDEVVGEYDKEIDGIEIPREVITRRQVLILQY